MQKTFLKLSLLLSTTLFLTAQTINIVVPEVPKVTAKVPEVPQISYIKSSENSKTNEEILREVTAKKVIKFSNHVAPVRKEIKDSADKVTLVGDIKNGKVTAYLQAPLRTPDEVQATLESAGFKVLSTFKVDKKGFVNSVVFTNDDLIKLASKKGRGFAASLHVTVDKKNSIISITNPVYVLAAFMQNEYDEKVALKTLTTLRDAFKNLKNSNEVLKFRIIGRYQFMAGMPKYGDMQVIKELPSATLLANARKSKKVIYEQKLLNGSTIMGIKLSKRTTRFIKKTGYQNAGLLPYPVLIENNKVKILDPKYYIAIMYPMLKMSQFMTIATVPGAINKDIDKVFR
jgi:hypothetical protein